MTERVPDFPPRIIEVHVTQGEELIVIGEDSFAAWELDAVYAALLDRGSDDDTHCEGCACEETTDTEGGTTA
jgi:hypothetical protein